MKLQNWPLVILLFLSSATHIIYALRSEVALGGDAFVYDYSAKSFAERGKFIGIEYGYSKENDSIVSKEIPYTIGGIGYPFYLGIIYKVTGTDFGKKVALFFQALLIGLLVPLLGYWLTRRLTAVALLGFWPSGFLLVSKLNTEALSSAFLFLVIYFLWNFPSTKKIFAASIFASGLFLIRYEFFPLLLVLIFVGFYKKNILATLVLLGALLIPSIYNYMSLNKFIPLSTSSGRTLWLAATCQGNFDFEKNKSEFAKLYVEGDSQATDRNYGLAAKEMINSNPKKYFSCVGLRIAKVLFTAYGEPSLSEATFIEKIWKVFLRLLKISMVIGFLIASYSLIKDKKEIGYIFLGIFVYKFIFIHGFLYGEPRFFTIMEPLCLLTLFSLPIVRRKSF